MRRIAAVLGMFGAAVVASTGRSPSALASDETESTVERVTVVGVAGLRWTDVDRAVTPNLARLADRGSVGSLSVRSAPAVTCPAEGWLTLGAGTYAAVRDPAEIDPADGCAGRPIPAADRLPEIVELNRKLRFGARPGWLADQLGCVTAVGAGAALAAATGDGRISYDATCPATLLDAGALPEGAPRAEALRRFDQLVGQVGTAQGPRDVVMVLGLAETDARQPRLHVAVVSGPGFDEGWLRSTSTRRPPYVQLVDIAPTILRVLGQPFPDAVAGRPLAGEAPGRPGDLDRTRALLADTDVRAVQQRQVLGTFFVELGVLVAVLAGALVFLLWRGPVRRWRWVARLRLAAIGLSGVPAATFLANLLPWWRSSVPLLAIWAAVILWSLAILAVALLTRSWQGEVRLAHLSLPRTQTPIAAVAAITVAVFVVDGLTGSWLQLSSLLGYNPLVAGRFVGFGNIAFSVLGAAAIAVAAFLAHGRSRSGALGAVALVAVPVLVLDGSPRWGADFGGVLTLVPAFAVLAMLVARIPVTWTRLVLAAGSGAAAVGLLGWLDYLRPEDERSHFGRFVGTVLDGSGLQTIHRKLFTSWELLWMGPHTLAAVVLAVALTVAVFRPPPTLARAYAQHGVLRPMLYATVALAGFGLATNDSGVAIPAVIALVIAPATLALCATENGMPRCDDAVPRRASL